MKNITIKTNITIRQAMKTLNKTAEKCLLVVDENKKLLGTLTDGDLRRALDSGTDFKNCHVKDVMTKNGKQITVDSLAASALALMENHRINALVVVDEKNKLCGILNMHDLLRARVI